MPESKVLNPHYHRHQFFILALSVKFAKSVACISTKNVLNQTESYTYIFL